MTRLLSFLRSLIPTQHVLSIRENGRESFSAWQLIWLGRVWASGRARDEHVVRVTLSESQWLRLLSGESYAAVMDGDDVSAGTGWERDAAEGMRKVGDAVGRMGDALRRTGAPE